MKPSAARPPWLISAALAAATLIAYATVFGAGFVWDDDDYVTANPTLRSLAGLWRIWTEPGAVPQYYPLTFTSLWVEFQLWGLSASGYHATNVLLHAANAVLVYLVLLRLAVPGAAVAAALFALHPVHVESVAWIAERKNVLSGLFYLAALLVYLPRLAGDAARWRYAAALALFVAALLSKTVTCTWPVVIMLLAWWRGRGWPRPVVREMAPALAFGVAAGLVTMWMETHHVGARGADWSLTFAERLLVAGRVPWFYLRTLVLPVQLTFIYPRWTIDVAALWQWAFPAATALAVLALFAARRRLGLGPLVAALFFLVTLAPAAGFIDVYPMRYSFVADHFQYLASLGPLVVAGALLWRAGANAALAVALGLGALTFVRGQAFADAETLWRDTIAKNPTASMPRLNLGLLLQQQGRLDEAIAQYERAIADHPDEADLHDNLAIALASSNRMAEAIAHWQRALTLAPGRAGTRGNLGNALAAAGDLAGAVVEYETALRIDPTHADVYNNLGNVLAMQGRVDEARARYEAALRHDPDFAQAHENLGRLLLATGAYAAAEHHLRRALALAPPRPVALQALGLALRGQGETQAALAPLEQAVRLAPDDPEFRTELGAALAAAGAHAAARAELERALALAPGHERAAAALRALPPGTS
ncbi:MAG TPA: tetratricopeptide repeat protein [Candidatus Limnocylindria bacterium]|nr:tetratricopeptide repeat protein [Candidatus Limnocylindria bacterium]